MNNAGLYSFASTTTWLHAIGVASPPLLVMLGLALPDSRILNGIASIGLSLANIAVILPHLRQPILDSMPAFEGALVFCPSGKGQIKPPSDKFNTAHSSNPITSPLLVPGPPSRREHLAHSSTASSVCTANAGPLGCPNGESEVTLQYMASRTTGGADGESPLNAPTSLYANSSDGHLTSSNLFSRDGRSALYIPLPVPDVEEVTFFDTEDITFFHSNPAELCEQQTILEKYSTIEDYETTAEQDGHIDIAKLSSTQEGIEEGGNSSDVALPVMGEKVVFRPTNITVSDYLDPLVVDPISDLIQVPVHGAIQNAQVAKCRPESLAFIPQSVIRRYPSAPKTFAKHDHQTLPGPPLIFVHSPAMLLEGPKPRASYATLSGKWDPPLVTEFQSMRRWIGCQTLIKETNPLQEGSPSPLEPPLGPEPTPHKERRLGVLARASLRNHKDGGVGSFTSSGDSDLENNSQYSSGSSAYEGVLPHMLGADLIAALDANSESGLNLVGSNNEMRTPLNVYEDYLISEDSEAGVSITMQVSSNDDGGDVGAPGTSRSLAYEDIQQWARGVVQKCVRQVCRHHVLGEPSSPSQASDVCAERPSGSGVSQCPLAGLHCRLGAAALTEISTPKTKETQVPLRPITVLPRRPFRVRDLRDIPEFVPRQRQVSKIAGRAEVPRRLSTRSATMDVTRDATAQVIARVEDQAGFNARRWLVGMDEKRMVNTAGGRQSTLRCA